MRPTGFSLVELMLLCAVIGVLAVIALPSYERYIERVRVAQAVNDIAGMGAVISKYALDRRSPPDTLDEVGFGGKLDPWERPYRYLNLATEKGKGGARKDKKLNPLNSDFDLYSVGKDGQSVPPLTPKVSHDDVVRARDGRFVGLAEDFDP